MESKQQPDDDHTVMSQSVAPVLADGRVLSTLGDNALPAGTVLGEFEITGLIGEGGFGIVYLAYDHSLQRKVALKEYLPSGLAVRKSGVTVAKSSQHNEPFQAGLRSFINEARLLAQFDHPSLVKVHRFWEANGTAYMVMPFYDACTLKETLSLRKDQTDELWLKRLLKHLLDALEIIHKENCFHRDIAPDNILILKDGRPLLLDFGAARRVISDMTQNMTVILKPGYAPIEQYAEMSAMKQGAWTDLYALAAVIYCAVTGKAPVQAVSRIISDSLEPLAKLEQGQGRYSPIFLHAIDKALAVKPEDRPQDIAEFRTLLGLVDSTISPSVNPPKLVKEKTGSSLAFYGFGTIIILVLVVGGWFLMQKNWHQIPELLIPEKNTSAPAPPTDHILRNNVKEEVAIGRDRESLNTLEQAPVIPEISRESIPEEDISGAKIVPPIDHVLDNNIEDGTPTELASEPSSQNQKPVRVTPEALGAIPDKHYEAIKPVEKPEQINKRSKPSSEIVTSPAATDPDRVKRKHKSSTSLIDKIVIENLVDGKICLGKKNYECAITKAEMVLQIEPSNKAALQLFNDANAGQDKAWETSELK